jgi:hypothetical protein
MIANRRSFLFGLGSSLIAAPAIVRAASLMPVKALEPAWMPNHFVGFDVVYSERLLTTQAVSFVEYSMENGIYRAPVPGLIPAGATIRHIDLGVVTASPDAMSVTLQHDA